jgi:hypothetical protein
MSELEHRGDRLERRPEAADLLPGREPAGLKLERLVSRGVRGLFRGAPVIPMVVLALLWFSETSPDTNAALKCGNRTQCNAVRRNRPAGMQKVRIRISPGRRFSS